jgi:hypothetical protein
MVGPLHHAGVLGEHQYQRLLHVGLQVVPAGGQRTQDSCPTDHLNSHARVYVGYGFVSRPIVF